MVTFFKRDLKKPVKAYQKSIASISGFYIQHGPHTVECSTWNPDDISKIQQELKKPKLFQNLESALNSQLSIWDYSVDSPLPMVRFAFSSLFLKYKKSPNTRVLINGLLQIDDSDFFKKIEFYKKNGIQKIKLKINNSENFSDDLFKNIPFQIRLDANQGLTLEEALSLCKKMDSIEYFEEPLKNTSQLENFFELTNIPYALDENKHLALKKPKGLAAVIIKPNLLGDFTDLKKITNSSSRIIISSSYETDIGLKSLIQWASYLNPTDHHGLGTYDVFLEESQLCVTQGWLHEI